MQRASINRGHSVKMYTCEHSCTALSEHVRSVSTIPANSCNLAQSEQVGASRHASRVGRSENAGAASRTQMRAELHSSGIQNNAGCTPVVRCAWRERTGRRIMALQANRPERAYEQRQSIRAETEHTSRHVVELHGEKHTNIDAAELHRAEMRAHTLAPAPPFTCQRRKPRQQELRSLRGRSLAPVQKVS
jgi:hypothetical protein